MMTLIRTLIGFVILLFLGISEPLSAQEPPHPPTNGHGNQGNQPPGGGARIGDGVAILVAFALAYSYRKIRQKRKAQEANPIEVENE
jgi:hypothetical protein